MIQLFADVRTAAILGWQSSTTQWFHQLRVRNERPTPISLSPGPEKPYQGMVVSACPCGSAGPEEAPGEAGRRHLTGGFEWQVQDDCRCHDQDVNHESCRGVAVAERTRRGNVRPCTPIDKTATMYVIA